MICRTVEEAYEAGYRAAGEWPPLTVEQATRVALLLAPYRTQDGPRTGTGATPGTGRASLQSPTERSHG